MAGNGFISVSAEIEEVQKALSGTSRSLRSIQRQTLGIIGKQTVKAIKQSIRTSGMERRTGEMLKAYHSKVKKDGSQVNIFPKSSKGTIFPKAMALSYGTYAGKERARRAFGFVQDTRAWLTKGAYMGEVEEMVSRNLKKYWS